jgi:hypothetical protein
MSPKVTILSPISDVISAQDVENFNQCTGARVRLEFIPRSSTTGSIIEAIQRDTGETYTVRAGEKGETKVHIDGEEQYDGYLFDRVWDNVDLARLTGRLENLAPWIWQYSDYIRWHEFNQGVKKLSSYEAGIPILPIQPSTIVLVYQKALYAR